MKLLLVGGTRFIGRAVVNEALARGHEVALYHRGEHEPPDMTDVPHIHGDTLEIGDKADEIRSFAPDAAIDTTQARTATTESVVNALTGVVKRYVLVSSMDVYVVYGRIHRTEPGPPQPMPVDETAELRKLPGADHTDEIDNLYAERAALGQDKLPTTIARLPAVFGPNDYQRRIGSYVDMMKESDSVVEISETLAKFRWTWGYVENVADALIACASSTIDGHQIFNVGYPGGVSNQEVFEMTAEAVGWNGKLVTTQRDHESGTDLSQDWIADTSKIRNELGYTERVSMQEAIRRTVEAELSSN